MTRLDIRDVKPEYFVIIWENRLENRQFIDYDRLLIALENWLEFLRAVKADEAYMIQVVDKLRAARRTWVTLSKFKSELNIELRHTEAVLNLVYRGAVPQIGRLPICNN